MPLLLYGTYGPTFGLSTVPFTPDLSELVSTYCTTVYGTWWHSQHYSPVQYEYCTVQSIVLYVYGTVL